MSNTRCLEVFNREHAIISIVQLLFIGYRWALFVDISEITDHLNNLKEKEYIVIDIRTKIIGGFLTDECPKGHSFPHKITMKELTEE